MSRLLLACAVLVTMGLVSARRADARRVVHMPTLAELCPGNAEWTKVTECMKRNGVAFKLVRDQADVKLVHVTAQSRFAGLYVFMHRKQWKLRGELHMYLEHDLLRFEPVKLGKHTGYRLDAGVAMATSHSLDGETSVPAVLRQQLTLVCFEDDRGCVQVMTSCDLQLHGKAFYSFRGKLEYSARQLKVVGDRRNAGTYCQQPELVLSD